MQDSERLGTFGKEAYYFPHDANAQNDPKISKLIETMGPEGVGIYWMLVEVLRDQKDYKYPMTGVGMLARRWNTIQEKVTAVIRDFGLFEIGPVFFESESLTRRMGIVYAKRKKLSESGKKGNSIRWRSGGDRVAIAKKEKERKRDEKIGEEIPELISKKPGIYKFLDEPFLEDQG